MIVRTDSLSAAATAAASGNPARSRFGPNRISAIGNALAGALMLIISTMVSAEQPAELRALLTGLKGTAPADGQLTLTYDQRNDKDIDPPPQPATINAEVVATGNGVRVAVGRATLDRALAESRETETENRKPVGLALSQVSTVVADRYLNAAPHLLALLERGKVNKVSQGRWRGRPATILELVVEPRLSKQQRKYIRELDASARIWLDASGYPLAAEERMDLSGRALLVINFDSTVRERFEFAHRDDRLIATRHRRREASSGGGESGSRTTEARLVLTRTTAAETGINAATAHPAP